MIDPGFPGGLPILLMADRAAIYIDGTPLSYDVPGVDPDYEWQGYRLDLTGDYNYFVSHFVVPPWMPASAHVRAILRVDNPDNNPYLSTLTKCHWGAVGESSETHSASTNPNLSILTSYLEPTNVAAGGVALTGLAPGDIVTCEFIIHNDVGPATEPLWFVGFEVYP